MILYIRLFQADNVYVLGCTIFSKYSQIKPIFLHSMCIGEIRAHAKFQVPSFIAPFIGIKNALQNGITLGVLDFRKYVKRLDEN